MTSVFVLNGPNLNLLGTRQPEVYGSTTLPEVHELCRKAADTLGLELVFRQSNSEGELIDWIHEAGAQATAGSSIGAVFNPGAFTHTSIALRDAIEGTSLPVVELHISNVHSREGFRHHSFIAPVARGIVAGFGVQGYALAINGLHALDKNSDPEPGESVQPS